MFILLRLHDLDLGLRSQQLTQNVTNKAEIQSYSVQNDMDLVPVFFKLTNWGSEK